jgi:hypothetical protein
MTFDSDDLPVPPVSSWALFVDSVRARRPNGRPRVHVNREVAFYVRLGPTADWRENRRRYWRARRAR